jgi:ABC-type lipoprotein release transport system permease subunit
MMDKATALFRLGFKYLRRHRRRYSFLLIALIFCFSIVTFITSTKDGMYDNVYYAAQSHYAGDIVAVGYNSASNRHLLEESEITAIQSAVRVSGIDPQYTVRRTITNGIVFYNGTAAELKYLIGCDWEEEEHIFDKMSFSIPPEPSRGDDGIILSAPLAGQLGAGMGDRIVLEVETRSGQKNTGSFIVKGIVQDISIFGYYKAYISRPALNNLVTNKAGDCSNIGFFFSDPSAAEEKRQRLQEALRGKINVGPLVHDREEMDREVSRFWEGSRIFLFTLPVYLSEISDMLDAMNIITYFIYATMLLIILVSAAVTYRLILHERTREMGTMLSIGFYGRDLGMVLWTEIIILGIVSLFAGLLLAWLLSGALSLLSFSWFPSFEIFMKNGKLTPLYLPGTMLVNAALVFFILLAAAFGPIFRTSRKNLSGLLSGEPL